MIMIQVYKIIQDNLILLGECSRERGNTQQKDLKLHSVGECAPT